MNEGTVVPHPLDPLTADEIRQAAAIVRREREVGEGWRFASIELREPAKADLSALSSGRLTGREALVVCWNRADGRAYRAVVSLTGDAVTAWEHLPGQQPNMTIDEWHECDVMLRDHPALIAALARRGITDRSRVLSDMWAYGAALVPGQRHHRPVRLAVGAVPDDDDGLPPGQCPGLERGQVGLGRLLQLDGREPPAVAHPAVTTDDRGRLADLFGGQRVQWVGHGRPLRSRASSRDDYPFP